MECDTFAVSHFFLFFLRLSLPVRPPALHPDCLSVRPDYPPYAQSQGIIDTQHPKDTTPPRDAHRFAYFFNTQTILT